MDSQRWQQERQPGDAGRGGSHSPHVRSSKVTRGPDASLVAYQDSRTHAARQHWGPSKPFDLPAAEPTYEQPSSRQPTSSRTAYTSPSSYAGSSAAPASSAPRTQPADPYSSYQQPTGGRDPYSQSSYSSYPAQSQADPYSSHGRSTASTAGPYATPRYFGYFDEDYLVYR
jgi:hypothetical protein